VAPCLVEVLRVRTAVDARPTGRLRGLQYSKCQGKTPTLWTYCTSFFFHTLFFPPPFHASSKIPTVNIKASILSNKYNTLRSASFLATCTSTIPLSHPSYPKLCVRYDGGVGWGCIISPLCCRAITTSIIVNIPIT